MAFRLTICTVSVVQSMPSTREPAKLKGKHAQPDEPGFRGRLIPANCFDN